MATGDKQFCGFSGSIKCHIVNMDDVLNGFVSMFTEKFKT